MVTNRNTLALALCLLSSVTGGAQTQQPGKRARTIEPLPRDLEIQARAQFAAITFEGQRNGLRPQS
jgi:hypothetical protein